MDTCRRCKRPANPIDENCRFCGAPLRVSDPRFCPWCGKLKNLLVDLCEDCANAYVPPEMRPPVIVEPPPPEIPKGECPNCGFLRPIDDKRCPWCNNPLPPIPSSSHKPQTPPPRKKRR